MTRMVQSRFSFAGNQTQVFAVRTARASRSRRACRLRVTVAARPGPMELLRHLSFKLPLRRLRPGHRSRAGPGPAVWPSTIHGTEPGVSARPSSEQQVTCDFRSDPSEIVRRLYRPHFVISGDMCAPAAGLTFFLYITTKKCCRRFSSLTPARMDPSANPVLWNDGLRSPRPF